MRSPCAGAALDPPLWTIVPNKALSLSLSLSLRKTSDLRSWRWAKKNSVTLTHDGFRVFGVSRCCLFPKIPCTFSRVYSVLLLVSQDSGSSASGPTADTTAP